MRISDWSSDVCSSDLLVFQDRVGIRPEEFYRRLRVARELPTTSQPTPGDFVRVFRSALLEADEVVAVLLSGSLSGTFQAAQAAIKAARSEGRRVGKECVSTCKSRWSPYH